ncbi:hypothetical protein A11A3_08605 [Alcanivorax hongdengensis A-11-3]|uniref:Uncharacterized protein n=1 Tax=Alcanivorax hongdengensis A-11-3 TaxID=1177179 RepID=L0WCI6_9GAMM|nr:hypothetical protein [Alcanivorax hongdengensis]EKF74468.1 hypothetical protein A11A3_08605 [Alcanivorax hongdengensis A-11-3]
MSKIVPLQRVRPDAALENLNRLTGLDFQSWPESLIQPADDDSQTKETRSASAQSGLESFPQCVSRQG